MKLLYNLTKEGISNERIEAKLNSLSSIVEKNEYCIELIEKKKLLERLYNQCNQLKLKFSYDLNDSLKNLDKINKNTLKSKIASNLANEKKNKTVPKIKAIPKQSKKERAKVQSVKQKVKSTKKKKQKNSKKGGSKKSKRKTRWITIISTPMQN
jgi:hypothetical protein